MCRIKTKMGRLAQGSTACRWSACLTTLMPTLLILSGICWILRVFRDHGREWFYAVQIGRLEKILGFQRWDWNVLIIRNACVWSMRLWSKLWSKLNDVKLRFLSPRTTIEIPDTNHPVWSINHQSVFLRKRKISLFGQSVHLTPI